MLFTFIKLICTLCGIWLSLEFIIKGIKDKNRSLVFEGFTLLLVTILYLLAVI